MGESFFSVLFFSRGRVSSVEGAESGSESLSSFGTLSVFLFSFFSRKRIFGRACGCGAFFGLCFFYLKRNVEREKLRELH
jgi:hypothetical protein